MSLEQLAGGAAQATIYDRIWAAIADRRLQPGTRLKEEKLGEIFGASRARVRSALSTLEKDGLVTLLPHRGAFVAEPSIKEARDIFFARRVVEASLVERLCGTLTPDALSRLKAHVEKEHEARRKGDVTSVIRLSGGFHLLIGELAGSPYLAEILRDLVSRTSLIIVMYEQRNHADCGPDEHEAITALIARGDAAGAVAASTDHLSHIEERLDLQERVKQDVDLKDILG